jgi:drug/metabolite transporter (DMT)-like permease
VVGFAGVLLMLDPWGITFHAMSLVVLLATFSYAISTVLVRLISRHDHDAATIFWFSLAASVISLVGAIPEWIWPSAIDWVWLVGIGLLAGVAQILSVRSLRLAEAGVLAPFDYTSIVLAVLFGYLWFKEQTSPMVWWGLPLVIGSGLYILYRERVRARETAPLSP